MYPDSFFQLKFTYFNFMYMNALLGTDPGPPQEREVLLAAEPAPLPLPPIRNISVSVCPCGPGHVSAECSDWERQLCNPFEAGVRGGCELWLPGEELELFKHSYKQCELFIAKLSLKPVP